VAKKKKKTFSQNTKSSLSFVPLRHATTTTSSRKPPSDFIGGMFLGMVCDQETRTKPSKRSKKAFHRQSPKKNLSQFAFPKNFLLDLLKKKISRAW